MPGIRVRLTALFVIIFGSTLVLLSALGYRFFSQTQQADFDTALFNHTVDVASTIDLNFFGEISIPELPDSEIMKIFPFSLRRSHMQVLDMQAHVLARSGSLQKETLPLSESEYEMVVRRGLALRTIPDPILPQEGSGSSYRLLSYRVSKPPLPQMILQVAAPMTFLERTREDIRSFIFIAIPLVLTLATTGGLFFGHRALAPVSAMTRKADSIEVGNLSERIPLPPSSHDEIGQLALTLNRLLDRIETTVTANQRFVADASHQLKTPLSILRGELDLMRGHERSPEEIRAFLESASQEIDSLTHLVESLLILARVEAGSACLALSPVRLDEIVLDCVSSLSALAVNKKIRLKPQLESSETIQAQFETKGDPGLLRTLIENLIENAIKYSPESSTIDIMLQDAAQETQFQICDQGPGIAPEKFEKIFERFYRDPTTQGYAGDLRKGFGLGLSIAQSIAKAHQTTIEVSTAPGGGTCFSMRMKKY